jgi:hypothetical protein
MLNARTAGWCSSASSVQIAHLYGKHVLLLLLLLLLQGDSTWAPIMGTAYYASLSQWSKGEYQYANQPQDDIAIIAGKVGYAPPSNGNTMANATALVPTVSAGTATATASGVIEQPGDADMFKLQAGAAGTLSFSVSVLTAWDGRPRSNLDAAVKILSAAGVESPSTQSTAGLAVSGTAALPSAGAYYIAVSGSGSGDPFATGYLSYASLGQFSLKATYPDVPVVSNTMQVIKAQPLSYSYDKKSKKYYCSFVLKVTNAASQGLASVAVAGSWQAGTAATAGYSGVTSSTASNLGQVSFGFWAAASAQSCTARHAGRLHAAD